jgi:[protein-PII] uridylyltransferase
MAASVDHDEPQNEPEDGAHARRRIVDQSGVAPSVLREELWSLASSTLVALADRYLPNTAGWSLLALAGTAKRQLCPGSDLDLLLLHPDRAPDDEVAAVAQRLWYPLWDAGWKVTPLVHSRTTLKQLTSRDLVTATSVLDTFHFAGDEQASAAISDQAIAQWRRSGETRLREITIAVAERHAKHGEVAFLLEPDLKEGQGGLRDLHAIDWACATDRSEVVDALEIGRETLAEHEQWLLDVRTTLHVTTNRPANRLLLQEQAGVAAAMGLSDDELMLRVSTAGREVQWVAERFWESIRSGRRRHRPVRPNRHVEVRGPRVSFAASDEDGRADVVDMLRVAAVAAQSQTSIDRVTLERFARDVEPLTDVWPEEARQALVSLFGAGRPAIAVIEALDRYRLFERVLPEWGAVRCRPQRNAYHRFTVDRHLCETAANAAALVRTVRRPDLLLIGALLHDIGKGFPGDHTVVGMELIADIGTRLGYDPDDVGVLVSMVEHHLLLPEVATRRDLGDPATIEGVGRAVGRVEVLELLGALTEADSLATGSTAWSDWKKQLVHQLVEAVRAHMIGVTPPPALDHFPGPEHLAILEEVRSDGKLRIVPGHDRCVVAAPDRTGLLSAVAGTLALHGVEVRSASGWSSGDGLAVEEYRIERQLGGEMPWKRIEADLGRALVGELDLRVKLRERAAAYAGSVKRLSAAPSPPPAVLIDHGASSSATLVEVRAPDRVGVLHLVADAIASAGFDISVALVETLGHEVVDVFYLRPANVGEVADHDRLIELTADILARLAE